MKGKVKIELFDSNGLLKKKIEKDNMITNAIDSIINPPFPDYFEIYKSSKINHHRIYSPIYKNLIGGIFLFNSERTENVNHILPMAEDFNSYVGSAGGNYTGTTEKVKGSLNLNESQELETGYKYVWDFGTGKSFSLSSLSLTSRNSGNIGLDVDFTNDTSKGEIFGQYGTSLTGTSNNPSAVQYTQMLSNIPQISLKENGTLCFISDDFKTVVFGTHSNNSYNLTKYNFRDNMSLKDDFNTSSYNIDDYTNWEKDLVYTITPTTTLLSTSLEYTYFEDNFLYSVNNVYSSTDKLLTINFTKINIDTMTISEEKVFNISLDTYSNTNSYVVCGNKLLINDGKLDRITIINLTTEELEDIITYTTLDTSYDCYIMKFTDTLIGINRGYQTNYVYLLDLTTQKKFLNKMTLSSTGTKYTNFINMKRLGLSPIFVNRSIVSGNPEYNCINFNLFEGFFASIINFDTIHKSETDTLKITYTITN
jgi:hypothetical protein